MNRTHELSERLYQILDSETFPEQREKVLERLLEVHERFQIENVVQKLISELGSHDPETQKRAIAELLSPSVRT